MKKNELSIEQTIRVGRKKYPYTLRPLPGNITHMQCKAAGINQEFANNDLLEVIMDLPQWIIEQQNYEREQVLRFRCSAEERREIARRAMAKRFPNISAFLRALALLGEIKSPEEEIDPKVKRKLKKILAKIN